MKNIIFLLLLCGCGCGCASNSKYSVTTEAKTCYYPFVQHNYSSQQNNIEKIDLSIQFKKDW